MKDLESLYIQLCNQTLDIDDYQDKRKVRENNKAMKKLNNILVELQSNIPYAIELLSSLIKNENEKVRLAAASHCLQMNILVDEARDVLYSIRTRSQDKSRALNAEMVLKYCGK